MGEATLVEGEDGGLGPAGEGWFVLNAREARWSTGDFGECCAFETDEVRFRQLGINLSRLEPGETMTLYHRELAQEEFLVLTGECLLVVEGEERRLRQWDLFHCPPGVAHAIVGAGEGPSIVLAVGARTEESRGSAVYPADPVAQKHKTGVEIETSDPREAYAPFELRDCAYEKGWLPR